MSVTNRQVPVNPRAPIKAAPAYILYDAISEAQAILADHLADRITPPDRAANVACARVFVALTSDELREAELSLLDTEPVKRLREAIDQARAALEEWSRLNIKCAIAEDTAHDLHGALDNDAVARAMRALRDLAQAN